jgi:hypothetical protein
VIRSDPEAAGYSKLGNLKLSFENRRSDAAAQPFGAQSIRIHPVQITYIQLGINHETLPTI